MGLKPSSERTSTSKRPAKPAADLREYGAKRDFQRTPEPAPRRTPVRAAAAPGRLFVVQKHAARNLHYDLRLQIGDTLKSWAVPKGPSFDPADKRLAVHVEDHPLAYGAFEGTIPRGQYGGGTVMLWDRGTWTPEGEAEADYRAGKLKFSIAGQRMRGRWMLLRGRDGQEHWLFFKERDGHANPALTADAFTTSVSSGRTMDEIAAGAPPRTTPTPRRGRKATRATAGDNATGIAQATPIPGARAAPMPRSLRLQLATASERPPEGDDWLHEVKFDGYRLLAFKSGEEVRLRTRGGQDWTAKLPKLVSTISERVRGDAVLDGEAVVLDRRGISDFQALQNAIHNRRAANVVYFAFDLPWCDGHDLARVALEERRRRLAVLLGRGQEGRLRLSEHIDGNGPAVYRQICAHGLEGVVSKRRNAPYSPGRSSAWLKVKCFNRQEFVVGGFTPPEGSRSTLGALLVGYYDEGELVYAGRVGTGFSGETLRTLERELRARVQPEPPFANPPTGVEARGVTWVRPELVAEVRFRDWTREGVVRHPSFRGLRDDRDPREVRREPSVAPPVTATAGNAPDGGETTAGTRPTRASTPAPPAARLTNPDRVVFPDRGAGYAVTKRQLAEYYDAVAERMLPHVAGRPLAIVRCPEGEGTACFFQKHRAAGMPPGVLSVPLAEDGETKEHLVIRDRAGLLGLVQMNALEVHPWGARADRPDRPDRLVFDFDPGPGVAWREVVEAATLLRDGLGQVGLTGFARTTGGKGVHVVVPIQRRHTWEEAKAFCKAVADAFAQLSPTRFVAVSTKARREGRVYVDYLRNARGATAVGPYSTRARPGGPVALPVAWEELTESLRPEAFNVLTVPRRLISGVPDPWAGMQERPGRLPKTGA